MHHLNRRNFLLTLSASLALPMAACNGGSSSASSKSTINWWHLNTQDPLKSAWQNYANAYMKTHPDVTIKITSVGASSNYQQKLETSMQAGNPPDLFQSWGGGPLADYVKAGQVMDITSAIQQNGWGDSFGQGPLNLYKVDGHNYGVPWDAGAVGFWYNTDLFSKANISTPPATWDEFLATITKLKNAGITPLALGEGERWPGAFYWEYLVVRLGGQAAFTKAYTRKGSFADKPFVQAGDHLKQLLALDPFENGWLAATYTNEQEAMGNAKAAMELMGQWGPANDLAAAANGTGAKLSFFPFPTVSGGLGDDSDVLGGGNGFAISHKAPSATVDFVRFLTSAENQRPLAQKGALIPPVKAASDGVIDPQMQKVQALVSKAKYYQLYYDQYFPAAIGTSLNDLSQGLFAGTTSPEQMAQGLESSVAANLK